ncbi:MAG: YcbK family protein [Rhodospirillales bacterium]
MPDNADRFELTRRRLLGLGAGAFLGLVASPSWARLPRIRERSLALQNINTAETLKTVYWADGRYLSQGLREISRLLRDYRTDEVKPIDPQLLDFLFALRDRLGSDRPFEVVSAYRSPSTNAMLRNQSRGVARNSLHMQGKAVDIRLPGFQPSQVARAARAMKRGGVGSYRRFTHLDVGEIRTWSG